jgi:hypothetical protein
MMTYDADDEEERKNERFDQLEEEKKRLNDSRRLVLDYSRELCNITKLLLESRVTEGEKISLVGNLTLIFNLGMTIRVGEENQMASQVLFERLELNLDELRKNIFIIETLVEQSRENKTPAKKSLDLSEEELLELFSEMEEIEAKEQSVRRNISVAEEAEWSANESLRQARETLGGRRALLDLRYPDLDCANRTTIDLGDEIDGLGQDVKDLADELKNKT